MKKKRKTLITFTIPALEYKKFQKFARSQGTTVKALYFNILESIGRRELAKRMGQR